MEKRFQARYARTIYVHTHTHTGTHAGYTYAFYVRIVIFTLVFVFKIWVCYSLGLALKELWFLPAPSCLFTAVLQVLGEKRVSPQSGPTLIPPAQPVRSSGRGILQVSALQRVALCSSRGCVSHDHENAKSGYHF